jgi:hypothetical protein
VGLHGYLRSSRTEHGLLGNRDAPKLEIKKHVLSAPPLLVLSLAPCNLLLLFCGFCEFLRLTPFYLLYDFMAKLLR